LYDVIYVFFQFDVCLFCVVIYAGKPPEAIRLAAYVVWH